MSHYLRPACPCEATLSQLASVGMNKAVFATQLLRFARILVLAYLAVLALVRIFESHLIFFPNMPSRLDGDWHPQGLPVEDVWLHTSDDVTLHAWWIPWKTRSLRFSRFTGTPETLPIARTSTGFFTRHPRTC